MSSLRITEIYPSIQGESTHAGRPCVFIRLTGCPLRCVWCDTSYAFTGGKEMTIAAIVDEATRPGLPLVEVTGGWILPPATRTESIPRHHHPPIGEKLSRLSVRGAGGRIHSAYGIPYAAAKRRRTATTPSPLPAR